MQSKKQEISSTAGPISVWHYYSDAQTRNVPLLFIPAFSTDAAAYAPTIKALVERGHVIFFPLLPVELVQAHRGIEVQKAEILAEIIPRLAPSVHVLGHSEGAILAVHAASAGTEVIERVVLVNPAGLLGPDPLPRLAWRFTKEILQQYRYSVRNWRRSHSSRQALGKILEALVFRTKQTVRETASIVNENTIPLIQQLRSRHRFTIIHSKRDRVFPMIQVRPLAEQHVDQFIELPGIHNSLYLDPIAYAEAITDALS